MLTLEQLRSLIELNKALLQEAIVENNTQRMIELVAHQILVYEEINKVAFDSFEAFLQGA